MTAMNDNRQYCHIGWIDSGDARGLRQILRTVRLQFFPTFKPNGRAFVIIEPFWNQDVLIQFRLFRCLTFLLNIRRIMAHNF